MSKFVVDEHPQAKVLAAIPDRLRAAARLAPVKVSTFERDARGAIARMVAHDEANPELLPELQRIQADGRAAFAAWRPTSDLERVALVALSADVADALAMPAYADELRGALRRAGVVDPRKGAGR
jgi:hypothetical protein